MEIASIVSNALREPQLVLCSPSWGRSQVVLLHVLGGRVSTNNLIEPCESDSTLLLHVTPIHLRQAFRTPTQHAKAFSSAHAVVIAANV